MDAIPRIATVLVLTCGQTPHRYRLTVAKTQLGKLSQLDYLSNKDVDDVESAY